MSTGERCLERKELERVVGAYIESIFRTALAIELDHSNERLVEALAFYRNQERRALEVLFTHRKLHGC